MALPTISDIGRVTADSEIRYLADGKPVTNVRLAFNKSRFNDQTQQWETTKTFFVDGAIWEQAAERAAQQLLKGVEVYVLGELETQQWEQDGQKRSKPALTIRRFKVIPKADQPGGQAPPYGSQSGPPPQQYGQQPPQQAYGQQPPAQTPYGHGGGDPWASVAPGGYDGPPF